MREVTFQKKNATRWEEIEKYLDKNTQVDSDKLADLYIGLGDDLAFAKTNYPGSKTEKYLNHLVMTVHRSIYKNKRYNQRSIAAFWTHDLPLIMYTYRRAMWTSVLIFGLSVLIGVISTSIDPDFPRLIMGDQYVDDTIRNIENGKPLDVYAQAREDFMFLYITSNNIYVSFLIYAAGALFTLGTAFLLFRNGVMLGAFQYFFYQKGVLGISLLTIWVHGTLEISAIVIAGGAGIVLGNSWLYPGTYSRMESLQKGAKDSVKIIIGLVPIFIAAGFLESFVTRHSLVNPYLAASTIACSIAFISFYFIYYPYKVANGTK